MTSQDLLNLDPAFHHIPVLLEATMAGLQVKAGGIYLDCTVGGGGHSDRLLVAAENVRLVAIDRDAIALAAAQVKLAPYGDRVTFWHGNFCDYVPPVGLKFDGILADLGVSSAQLDQRDRGFSFREEGALDMRMDQRQTLTAAEIVNTYDETELANLIFTFGEERLSRRIARQIVERRPFTTTIALAETISRSVPKSYRYGRIHPATRTFQALRIAVNGELDALQKFLKIAPDWLAPDGRLAIISFHSLEDRLVKYAFREDERLKIVTKKPIAAQEQEAKDNPRSRSAKLRVAARLSANDDPSEGS